MSNLKQCIFYTIVQFRQFSIARLSMKNYYDTLGITPNATLSDIKKAYYDLSMVYHPDKSADNAEALEKFRNITEAYEVLSNLKSKRLYDKGVLYQAPIKTERPKPKKQTVIIPEGRTQVYNFDLWNKTHYEERISQRTAAKERFSNEESFKKDALDEKKVLIFIFWITAVLGSSIILFEINNPGFDVEVKKHE